MSRLAFPGGLNPQTFLSEHWQKKPLLMRGAVTRTGTLSPDELAGLALEPDVEARLVRPGRGAQPRCLSHRSRSHDLTSLPRQDWTLLVQDVDKHLPALAGFLDRFDFIPSLAFRRPDDQRRCARRWRGPAHRSIRRIPLPGHRSPPLVDRQPPGDYAERRRFTHSGKSRISRPQTSMTLGPGDVLYLPPGIPHDGVAEDLCTTWSVGFRAPTPSNS